MGIMLEEIHFTTVTCGAPTRAAVLAELKARCAGHLPHMQECWVSQLIDLREDTPEETEISWHADEFARP